MTIDYIGKLKACEPASLKVTLSDGTEKPVAVPRIRNRWQRVQQTIDALPWVRIEALDKSGAVLGMVEDESGAGEFVEQADDDMRLAKILLEVMRSTQKETRLMFEVQMRGQAELVEALISGVRSISQSYEQSLAVQRAAMVTDAAGGERNPELMAMLQLAMAQMTTPKQVTK